MDDEYGCSTGNNCIPKFIKIIKLSIKIKFTKADFIAMLKDSLTQDAALVILALLLRKDIITVVDTNLYTLSSQINFLLT